MRRLYLFDTPPQRRPSPVYIGILHLFVVGFLFLTVEGQVVVNQGPYESHYTLTCASAGNLNTGRTNCKNLGNGYDIATVPTSNAQSAVVAAFPSASASYNAWVGVTDEATEGSWVYIAGRLQGLVYSYGGTCATSVFNPFGVSSTSFSFCNWNGGEPNDGGGEDCAMMLPASSTKLNDIACSSSGPCALCERSPCKMGMDCHPTNTQSIAGNYFPSCTCTCKSGFWGDKCEKVATNMGQYESHFALNCASAGTLATGRANCKAMGDGWDLATVPSSAAKAAVALTFPSSSTAYAWVGMTDETTEGSWVYIAGRLQGLVYSYGGTCAASYFNPFGVTSTAFSYCWWNSGEPNDASGEDCAVALANVDSRLNDIACSGTAPCAVCERSPCKIGVDCHPTNTQSIAGSYFPSCTCTCKSGFWGDKCEKVATNMGQYESHFLYVCPSSVVNAAAGRAACKSLGTGWDIATMPTPTAQSVVVSLVPAMDASRNAWIGLSDEATEGTWKFIAGRLQGSTYSLGGACQSITYNPVGLTSTIYNYCLWTSGEPNDSGANEDCAHLTAASSSASYNDVACTATMGCTVCERSPCKMGVDCHPTNTISMTGSYFPNCVCACYPSYWGSRCEKQSVVDQGPYISYYDYICSGNMNVDGGRAACKALGDGWDLGTIPTASAQTAVAARVPDATLTTYNAWIGISDSVTEGTWRFIAGRLNGLTYSLGGTCSSRVYNPIGLTSTTFSYCLWNSGEPNDTGGNEDCGQTTAITVNAATNDVNCANPLSCAVCERSPCKMGLDCHPTNTISMTGSYFPNCVCTCYPSYWGAGCEKQSVVNQGPYISYYDYLCPVNLTAPSARAACRALGDGWDIGTIPTAAAQAVVNQRIPQVSDRYAAWVGISDNITETQWQYTSGRLVNLTYSNGSTCVASSYNPYGIAGAGTTFNYCLWDTNEPTNTPTEFSTEEDCAYIVGMTGGVLNDFECGRFLPCVLCERSPCKMGLDCHPLNSISMTGTYFPNCVCTCKPSYWGNRCEKQSVVDQGPYISHYDYICPLSINVNGGRAACKALGDGWDIGTIPTAVAQAVVNQRIPQVSSTYTAWVGLSDATTEGVWQYTSGRLANRTNSHNSTCETTLFNPYGINNTVFNYCKWNINEPSNSPSIYSSREDCAFIVGMTTGVLNDYECYNRTLPCVLCERSPCEMGIDCHPRNTLSMTGTYFPNCQCVCKPGAGGGKCRYPHASPTLTQSSFSKTSTRSLVVRTHTLNESRSASISVSRTRSLNITVSPSVEPELTQTGLRTLSISTNGSSDTVSHNSSLSPSSLRSLSIAANETTASFAISPTQTTNASTSLLSNASQSFAQSMSESVSFTQAQTGNTASANATETLRPLQSSSGAPSVTQTIMVSASDPITASRVVSESVQQNRSLSLPNTDTIYFQGTETQSGSTSIRPTVTAMRTHSGGTYSPSNSLSNSKVYPPSRTNAQFESHTPRSVTATSALLATLSAGHIATHSMLMRSKSMDIVVTKTIPILATTTTIAVTATSGQATSTLVSLITTNGPSTNDSLQTTSRPQPTSNSLPSSTTTTTAPTLSANQTTKASVPITSVTELPSTPDTAITQTAASATTTTEDPSPTSPGPLSNTVSQSTEVNTSFIATTGVNDVSTTADSFSATTSFMPHPNATTGIGTSNITNTTASLSTTAPTVTTTALPDPFIYNGPEMQKEIFFQLFAAATVNAASSPIGDSKCLRLEQVLAKYSLLSPLYFYVDSYGGSLAVSVVAMVIICALGCISVVGYWLYRRLTREGHEERTSLSDAAASTRFPGTIIQVFIAMSHGVAIAAGLSIGRNGGAGGYIAILFLIICPILWTVLVRLTCHRRGIEVSEPPPTTPSGGILLLCAASRPGRYAKLYGPIIADLRFQSTAAPLIPMALPWLLCLVSIIVSGSGSCEVFPAVAGAFYALYAVFVVVLRPYLGVLHIVTEALTALTAAVILFIWQGSMAGGAMDDLTPTELSAVTALLAISNARYPFALARALDVILPKVTDYAMVPASTVDDSAFTMLCEAEEETALVKVLAPNATRSADGIEFETVEDSSYHREKYEHFDRGEEGSSSHGGSAAFQQELNKHSSLEGEISSASTTDSGRSVTSSTTSSASEIWRK